MNVVGFADFLKQRALTCGGLARHASTHGGFTRRDQADLDQWTSDERGVQMCSGETGTCAMLYRQGMPYSSWGLVRQGRTILLWDCVTLADIGRFPSMADALAAIPVADHPSAPTENVILFAAARPRGAALR